MVTVNAMSASRKISLDAAPSLAAFSSTDVGSFFQPGPIKIVV